MSEENPNHSPTQEATNNQGEPNVEPTPATHNAGGPSDPTSGPDSEDPVMQFVVHDFDRMNAMYKSFTQKLKDVPHQRVLADVDPPVIEPWNSDSDELHPRNTKENAFVESDNNDPSKSRATVGGTPLKDTTKRRLGLNNDFYHEPFVFKEAEKDVRDLVAFPFTKRIRNYDMPDGIKVPTNLRTYDGTTDPDDHLTIFMGTMDIHKLPEPAWCRFFQITLSGAARFWYDNLAPGSIDGFHQLRDRFRANFLQQRGKETLHMADRSDAMESGAFISGLRPGRLFKDLIAKPPTSLEELFTQTHNFIRAEDANNENRLREMKQHATYKDLPRRNRDKHVSRSAARHTESHRVPREAFTKNVHPRRNTSHLERKSHTSPTHKKCSPPPTKGRMAHLARGAKTHNDNQASGLKENPQARIEWSKKASTNTKPKKRDTYDPSRKPKRGKAPSLTP
ncbi:gag protein [Artemisia annua]|uniref:Gag protein n=1 Tax=Artemisia annua TaxID=35608 RepID=A0A2U1L1F9_ARTAN|nr:gag protein [Artemisia annua]